MTVAGERSRYFGPDGQFVFHANGARHDNLESDLFYRQVQARGRRSSGCCARPPPSASTPACATLVRGYVAGYNRCLARPGVDRLSDPACRGKPWVRPITEARRLRALHADRVAGRRRAGDHRASAKAQPPLAGAGRGDAG